MAISVAGYSAHCESMSNFEKRQTGCDLRGALKLCGMAGSATQQVKFTPPLADIEHLLGRLEALEMREKIKIVGDKHQHGRTQVALLLAMRGGFESPMPAWLRQYLRPGANEIGSDSSVLVQGDCQRCAVASGRVHLDAVLKRAQEDFIAVCAAHEGACAQLREVQQHLVQCRSQIAEVQLDAAMAQGKIKQLQLALVSVETVNATVRGVLDAAASSRAVARWEIG